MNILVRPLREPDLPLADRIFRLAFGTFNGLPDPLRFGGDIDKIRTRWLADPGAAFGAEVGGGLVGSNFVTHWGSVGYFGPLTVHPDFWDRGVGQKLLATRPGLFEAWGCRHTGLYTYSSSPKHLALYQKFGFWPRALTAIMSKAARPQERVGEVSLYSQAPASERPGLVAAAAGLTDAIYAGLDVQREIFALRTRDSATPFSSGTIRVWRDSRRCTLAPVPRPGAAPALSNSGRPGPGTKAGKYFDRLLTACEAYAVAQGARRLIAGISLARKPAYEQMRARGFKPEVVGVCMHKPNEPGYHRAEAWVIDDWR